MDTSEGNTLDLTELNETELRVLHEEKFGTPVGSVGAARLIEALQSGVPVKGNPIAPLQAGLVRAICRYKQQTSWVPECHGFCFLCPDGAVMACFNDNVDLITEGDMEMTCLNPYDLEITWEQVKADGALQDVLFTRQFLIKRGLLTMKDAHTCTQEQQANMVKTYFNVPCDGQEGVQEAEAPAPGAKKTKAAKSADLSGLTGMLQEMRSAITDLQGSLLKVELKLDFLATRVFLPNEAERVGSPFAAAKSPPPVQQMPPSQEVQVEQPAQPTEERLPGSSDDGY